MPYLLLALGVATLLGGIRDWGWFRNNEKARLLTQVIGARGTRIFYAALGLVLVALGAGSLLGWFAAPR